MEAIRFYDTLPTFEIKNGLVYIKRNDDVVVVTTVHIFHKYCRSGLRAVVKWHGAQIIPIEKPPLH